MCLYVYVYNMQAHGYEWTTTPFYMTENILVIDDGMRRSCSLALFADIEYIYLKGTYIAYRFVLVSLSCMFANN